MADSTYHFRSALGGFHKGDVLGYVEKLSAQHRSEILEYEKTITELREENHSLQQQLNLLMMATPAAAPAPEPAAPPEEDLISKELQAYRRAEAVERNANQRAKKLHQQLGDMCTETESLLQNTNCAVNQTLESMLAQAKTLEQTYQQLSAALHETLEKLSAVTDNSCDEADPE